MGLKLAVLFARLDAQLSLLPVPRERGAPTCAYCHRRATWWHGKPGESEGRCSWHLGGPEARLPAYLRRGSRR